MIREKKNKEAEDAHRKKLQEKEAAHEQERLRDALDEAFQKQVSDYKQFGAAAPVEPGSCNECWWYCVEG